VSRIEEALRRSDNRRIISPSGMNQRHFSSAWTEDETTPAASTPWHTHQPRGREAEHGSEAGAMFPLLHSSSGERLISDPKCSPAVVEQFRRLAAILLKSQAANGTRVLMVASASPADGKTLTAINLAVVLSASYKRKVLLIDADLRRPSIGALTGLQHEAGLSAALRAPNDEKLSLIPLTANLTVLPGGRPDADPTSSLSSVRMRGILTEAATQFDWVIVDSPPVAAVADASLIGEMVDKTVLVVRAAKTQFPVIQKTIETLGRERIIGVVLNAVERETLQHSHYYGQYGS
jgi:capsular exopolysaccharide synthesis family protein